MTTFSLVVGLITLSISTTDIFAQKACNPVTQCSCKLDDGRQISLWPIDQKNSPRFTVGDRQGQSYQYQYNPCTPFTVGAKTSECNNVLVCQSGSVGGGPFALAYKDPLVVNYNNLIKMYTFTYTGSTEVGVGKRKTVIRLKCDENANEPSLETFEVGPPTTYTTTLTSKYACLINTSQNKKGLSTGSILCIVFFVLLTVFMVGGILVNKFALHKEGSDVVPLKTFWVDLPSLVKDGVMFSYQKVKRKPGQYEKI